jgi:hypothetical protein
MNKYKGDYVCPSAYFTSEISELILTDSGIEFYTKSQQAL